MRHVHDGQISGPSGYHRPWRVPATCGSVVPLDRIMRRPPGDSLEDLDSCARDD
jgi:hypothetical protein